MQKLIRVSINETGGEFTCGTIESDQGDLIEEIKNKTISISFNKKRSVHVYN